MKSGWHSILNDDESSSILGDESGKSCEILENGS